MKYLITINVDESAFADATPEQMQESMSRWDAFTQSVRDAGAFEAGEGLAPAATATTVRIDGGDQVVSDGPFAETKEQLGGFYLLDCADLDDAIDWAKKMPVEDGALEVRPVMDYEARGSAEHTNAAEATA